VTAADNLGLKPNECVVIEDAISGVQAGSRGNFGLVLGIAREIEGSQLRMNGADIVVRDLGEITLEDIREWFDSGLLHEGWNLTYNEFSPKDERLRETLTSVGNGYMGVRGASESSPSSDCHYPGTYLAGIFNKLPSKVHGQTISTTIRQHPQLGSPLNSASEAASSSTRWSRRFSATGRTSTSVRPSWKGK